MTFLGNQIFSKKGRLFRLILRISEALEYFEVFGYFDIFKKDWLLMMFFRISKALKYFGGYFYVKGIFLKEPN